jgi:protein arginine kinase
VIEYMNFRVMGCIVIVDDLIKRPGPWLSMNNDSGIVISSRVRLARNLMHAPFPGWSSEKDTKAVYDRVRDALGKVKSLNDPLYFDMHSMKAVDKDVLRERRLISNEFVEKGEGSALVVAESENVAIMINEEDHLRLTAISPGKNIYSTWKLIDDVDSELEEYIDYAFSRKLGYLCSCPTNIGTGLRASVMMHLSGLRLINEIGQVVKGLEKMGFAVRGLLGEGSEAYGNMFQISNQSTLGETEEAIIESLSAVTDEVAKHEQNARTRLMQDRRHYVYDQLGRALGILSNAHVLTSNEAVDMLSWLRLGIEMSVVEGLGVRDINEMLLMIQPGHLQKIEEKVLEPEERDIARARIIREKLKTAGIVQ